MTKRLLPLALAGCFYGKTPADHGLANRYDATTCAAGAALMVLSAVGEATNTNDDRTGATLPVFVGGIGLVLVGVAGIVLNAIVDPPDS